MPWTDELKRIKRVTGQRTAPQGCRVLNRQELYRSLYGNKDVDIARVRTFIFTTSRVAKDDGVLLPDGMDATDFQRRPVIDWAHEGVGVNGKFEVGIGRGLEMRRVKEPENGWEVDIEFAPASVSEKGDAVFRFIDWAGFASCSAHFRVIDGDYNPDAETRIKLGLPRYGWVGRAWKLLSIGICNVPSDEGALMQAVRSGAITEDEAPGLAREAGIRWFADRGLRQEPAASQDTAAILLEEMRAGFAAVAEVLTGLRNDMAAMMKAMEMEEPEEEDEDEDEPEEEGMASDAKGTDGAGKSEEPDADAEDGHATELYGKLLGERLAALETKVGVTSHAS